MMEHPAGVGGAAFWIGPEVEGPLAHWRVRSAFIAAPIALHDLARLDEANVLHVFLCSSLRDWEWFEGVLLPWLTARALPLTIECRTDERDVEEVAHVRDLLVPNARLVVRFFANRGILARLGASDLVSVGAPYDLATFVLGDGVRTTPEQFVDDKAPA